MGSRSDWQTMGACCDTLDELGIGFTVRALSAHRTPDALTAFLDEAVAGGAEVIIAAAGGAAHLPGVVASKTEKPVLGVPMESKLGGVDSLLSIVQMPTGIPVGTLAVGKTGAVNAALLAGQILALNDSQLATRLSAYRQAQADRVLADSDPRS